MTPNIKISIIVPVFNSANFIDKCVNSLVNQTLQEIEIILVDDASTDNSLEILKKYEREYPEKIVVLHSEINQRQGGARNLALEIAKGEYIGFVDSDDWVEKNMYINLYKEAIKYQSDICYAKRKQIDEKGKTTKDSASYFFPTGEVTENNRKKMLINHITFVQRNIYKRSIFIENNIKFPIKLRYEDMLIDPLVIPCLKHISSINIPLYNYFIRSNSTMTEKNDTKYKDKICVCQIIVDEYKKRGLYEKYCNEVNYIFFRKGYIHTALNYVINSRILQKEVISELKNSLLEVDKNYRKNPYYKQRFAFCAIDRILDYSCLLNILKIFLKITKYNV